MNLSIPAADRAKVLEELRAGVVPTELRETVNQLGKARDAAQALLDNGELIPEEALLVRRVLERHAKLLANPELILATAFRTEAVR